MHKNEGQWESVKLGRARIASRPFHSRRTCAFYPVPGIAGARPPRVAAQTVSTTL